MLELITIYAHKDTRIHTHNRMRLMRGVHGLFRPIICAQGRIHTRTCTHTLRLGLYAMEHCWGAGGALADFAGLSGKSGGGGGGGGKPGSPSIADRFRGGEEGAGGGGGGVATGAGGAAGCAGQPQERLRKRVQGGTLGGSEWGGVVSAKEGRGGSNKGGGGGGPGTAPAQQVGAEL